MPWKVILWIIHPQQQREKRYSSRFMCIYIFFYYLSQTSVFVLMMAEQKESCLHVQEIASWAYSWSSTVFDVWALLQSLWPMTPYSISRLGNINIYIYILLTNKEHEKRVIYIEKKFYIYYSYDNCDVSGLFLFFKD